MSSNRTPSLEPWMRHWSGSRSGPSLAEASENAISRTGVAKLACTQDGSPVDGIVQHHLSSKLPTLLSKTLNAPSSAKPGSSLDANTALNPLRWHRRHRSPGR
jgi:hypothetical protein